MSMAGSHAIRFYYDGAIVEVSGVSTTLTVLDWLRETRRRTGTKEGCAEGDCGACTVLVGELKHGPDGAGLSLSPVNACIKFLPTLDGCALFTVDDLAGIADAASGGMKLHPVQQALVDCHGSQCGFCTPGFVMSLTATYERGLETDRRPTRHEIADDIAGNLCRCTGYRPILDAGERMFDFPPVRIDAKAVVAALVAIERWDMFAYSENNARFWSPRSIGEFASLRAVEPNARVLAGATDIGLWVNKKFADLGDIIYVGNVAPLKRIETTPNGLVIGAAVSLERAWAAISEHWPQLREMWLRFASPPIRNAGTIGGNIANGSPIGDCAPCLMALDASIVLRRAESTRAVQLADFYLDYMKNDMRDGEFLEEIAIPFPKINERMRAYKVSKRFDSDISAVCAALSIELGNDNHIAAARFAFGGLAGVVRRALLAEAAVIGRAWDETTLRAAQEAIASEFTPLTDLRASAAYRKELVQGLLRRFWLETRGDGIAPLARDETTVFSHLASLES